MNLSDTLFTAVAVGVGLGVGFGVGAHHGKMGFVVGFVGAVACVFILFTVVRVLLPRGSLRRIRKGRNQPQG